MKNILKLALTFLLSIFCSYSTFAVLTTHNWLESHRGYSIELVPGTGGTTGNPAEYVAAGTVYNGSNQPAWHFMHLDAVGVVLNERTTTADVDLLHEFRVVDIACESNNKFWITIQARNSTITPLDYIYIAGVDITGADLPLNPAIAIVSNNQYKNLYPTHSYFAIDNGFLYICGYATPNTEHPNNPDASSSDKIGMFLKVNVNGATPSVPNSYFWNTPRNNYFDHDQALKIVPYKWDNPFPLLVTGSVNQKGADDDIFYGGFNICNALAMKFTANAVPISKSAIHANAYSGGLLAKNWLMGIWGIDIRGGVYGGDNGNIENPDIVVLVNFIQDRQNVSPGASHLAYGIARIKNDLTARSVGTSLKYTTGWQTYAKQFMELHGNSLLGSSDNHIYIVGETESLQACEPTLPSGASSPSATNVNPFITAMHFGVGYYSYSTGFLGLTASPNTKIYLSSQSTSSTNMDYLNGSGVALREDIQRLYTFASLERHYNDPAWGANPSIPVPAMILPIADALSPDLKTKFLGLSHPIPLYEEANCRKHIENCTPIDHMEIFTNNDHFSDVENSVVAGDAYTIFNVVNSSYIPSLEDCATNGSYKPGRPTGINDVNKKTSFEIFPNPASNMLNINFGAMQGDFTVSVTDAQGKVVLQQEGKNVDKTTLSLPELSAGVYLVNIVTDKSTQTTKVTISK